MSIQLQCFGHDGIVFPANDHVKSSSQTLHDACLNQELPLCVRIPVPLRSKTPVPLQMVVGFLTESKMPEMKIHDTILLTDIMLISDFLQIDTLIKWCIQQTANSIKGKDSEEIREQWKLTDPIEKQFMGFDIYPRKE